MFQAILLLFYFVKTIIIHGGDMLRYLIVTITLLLFYQAISYGADKASVLTQKKFANLILQQFSLNAGLPKDPTDRDYFSILAGKRHFRYEAENAYNPETDRVTIRDFTLYGPFTGKGWILGVSDTTSSVFTILVPVAGEYDFKAVIKGNGFVWNINGKEYPASSKSEKLKEIDIAKVTLKAGVNTIGLSIPPEGGIDSFSLSAPDFTPIKPYSGWRFKEPLTAVRMAEVAVSLTNRYLDLPDADPKTYPKPIVVADKADIPATATLTSVKYLGAFSSDKWIRADYRGATLRIPITMAEAGYFTLTANIMGEIISGTVNDAPFKITGKSYLNKMNLGIFRLEAGDNSITVVLPPNGGIDNIEFVKKSASAADFLHLSGVTGPAERIIEEKEAVNFLKSIQGSFKISN